jgi:drug/metabolite transporter (DMT)-like permease
VVDWRDDRFAPDTMTASPERRATRNGRAAMLVAAVAWSSAGLAQRELDATPATQVLGRALFAFLALLALVALTERSGIVAPLRSLGRDGAAVAVFLAVSSGTFLLALNYTTVANVLFLQAASPMIAALLGWAVLSERISRRTWLAMGLAAVGVTVMVAGSVDAGAVAVALPILMTASFAIVIVITRYRRDVSMMPATCASQALVVVVAAPFASLGSANATDWGLFFVLGTFQIGAGLALLTVGARLLPPAEVALLSLLEVVLGPLWVWLAYSEQPNTPTLVGGVVVTAAVVVQATASDEPKRTPERAAVPAPDSG